MSTKYTFKFKLRFLELVKALHLRQRWLVPLLFVNVIDGDRNIWLYFSYYTGNVSLC
jgi:hypothetical protein